MCYYASKPKDKYESVLFDENLLWDDIERLNFTWLSKTFEELKWFLTFTANYRTNDILRILESTRSEISHKGFLLSRDSMLEAWKFLCLVWNLNLCNYVTSFTQLFFVTKGTFTLFGWSIFLLVEFWVLQKVLTCKIFIGCLENFSFCLVLKFLEKHNVLCFYTNTTQKCISKI